MRVAWVPDGKSVPTVEHGGITPSLDYGVAVAKGESTGVIMIGAWAVDPGIVARKADEGTVVDAVGILVDERPKIGRAGSDELGFLGVDEYGGSVVPDCDGVEPGVHGHAADVRINLSKEIDAILRAVLVGGVFVNRKRIDIGIKQSGFDIGLAEVNARVICRTERGTLVLPSRTPLREAAAGKCSRISRAGGLIIFIAVRNESSTIIVRIHFPGEGELTEIVHALRALGFLFGLGQGWQKHGGQDGDNCDDDEELNQSEGGRAALMAA